MMRFLIEATDDGIKYESFLVEAKTYSDALEKLQKMHGNARRTLLGQFSKSEVDKAIWQRTH